MVRVFFEPLLEGKEGLGKWGARRGVQPEPPGTAGERLGKVLDWPQPAQPGSTRDPDFGKGAMRFSRVVLLGTWCQTLWVGGVSFSGDPIFQHFGIGFEDLGGRSVLGGEELLSI